jgi:tRNA-dihydrouridine synthase
MPIFGNGDIDRKKKHYNINEYGIDGIMIGRAPLVILGF